MIWWCILPSLTRGIRERSRSVINGVEDNPHEDTSSRHRIGHGHPGQPAARGGGLNVHHSPRREALDSGQSRTSYSSTRPALDIDRPLSYVREHTLSPAPYTALQAPQRVFLGDDFVDNAYGRRYVRITL